MRYVSVRDLVQIIKGAVLSSVLVGVVVYPVVGFYSYPRSVVVLDSIVLIMLMGGIRVGTRLFRERNRSHFFDFDKKPVFIYGAGDAGELLLRDMHNNSKYNYQPVGFIDDDERKKGLKIHSVPVLGAGRDLEKLIKKFEPQEIIIVESVKNNVLGTWNLLELSNQFGVETFIQISTDKAVNPTSVMGVSKRIAEMAVKHMNAISRTRFIVVRFGNVLGSSGSVVPLFKEQIGKGGPVTVTHPDIQRYFMTIPEAVQLVLQAAYFGKGGERYKKISMAISTTNGKDTEEFFNQLIDLQVSVLSGDKDQIMEKIRELVPAYNPTVVESIQNGDIPGIIPPKAIDSINLSDYSASS